MDIEADNDQPEITTHCECCESPIFEGDKYHLGGDVDLCGNCAPSYQDLLNDPTSFVDSEHENLSSERARVIVDKHIAYGGKLTDRILS